ncbi:MAG: glycosyltransferase family 2 protein [Acidobacteria bacterium]|nr:glycosyltransferase family 2 protein [Acidobacteriota bacterium]
MRAPPDLSIVIVHYRTPELVGLCVEALRRDLGDAGLEAELILVDNGSESEDLATFEALGLQRIDPGANVGYAGGVNRGIEAASTDRLVVMNPDVLVLPGCVPELLAVLEGGFSAAGPRLYWDEGRRLLLPPNEPRRRLWELRASLAQLTDAWADRARHAWRRHALRHWTTREPLPSFELSGALLAFRRDAWDRVGSFDEAYPLYFEETDWLHRLRRAGGKAAYVPAAEGVHLYDQSARLEPRAAAWFAQSRSRFLRRHYGALFARLLEALERTAGSGQGRSRTPQAPAPQAEPPELSLPRSACWVEVSPRPAGFPAAAERLGEGQVTWQLPRSVWGRLGPGTYGLRLADADGRELLSRAFTKA